MTSAAAGRSPGAVPAGYRAAERLVHALMFEGYVLYPYRRTSLKNMQRFAFGTLQPPSSSSMASALRLECLVRGPAPSVSLSVRFLHYARRYDPGMRAAQREPWIEATERACELTGIDVRELERAGGRELEHEIAGEETAEAGVVRERRAVRVRIQLAAKRLGAELSRLRIDVENACGEADSLCSLGAVHALLSASLGAGFVSLLEPPADLVEHAGACCNRGCFPVLVGEPGDDRVLLASPIILYDRPAIAPESAGDFCDATEIDEMLSLRVLTLTDDERREALATDDKSRAIIERTVAQNEDALLALHGARRAPARAFAPGDSVRLRPKKGGEVLDLALAGEQATVASVEEDFEGRVHYAVTIDADPGRDLGRSGMPGHRFFFSAEELERVS